MEKIKEHLLSTSVALLLFFIISVAYLHPALGGKRVNQGDIRQHIGMSKEITDYREATGDEALWTNSIFGGMPAYLISTKHKSNILQILHYTFLLNNWRPIGFVFLYLLGFYIAMLAFGVNRWLSIVGAIAFAFSSYFFIIIPSGHNSKVLALGYMSAIIAGAYIAFKGRHLLGAAVLGLFLSLQLFINNFQITYYTFLIILILGIVEAIAAYKEKRLKKFAISVGALCVAAILAVGSNTANIWTTAEYSKYSTRGGGLEKEYATGWSYGVSETFTLLIPNFMGGATSYGYLDNHSKTHEYVKDNLLTIADEGQAEEAASDITARTPAYWGDQPSTDGPVYIGAIIVFLFVLGLYIVKSRLKWWLVSVTVLSILLSWGSNFEFFTGLFHDYFPAYNRFRTVSMILIMAEFAIPFLGILAIDNILKEKIPKEQIKKALLRSFYITGGLCLFFLLFAGGLFGFKGAGDKQFEETTADYRALSNENMQSAEHYSQQAQQYAEGSEEYNQNLRAAQQYYGYAMQSEAFAKIYEGLPEVLQKKDRPRLLRKDALRSLIFISLVFAMLWFFLKGKLENKYFIAGLGLLILVDMWLINKRYLNEDNFISEMEYKKPIDITQADRDILEKAKGDPDYRVLDLRRVDGNNPYTFSAPFNSAEASYYHKSIGGYHAAKMKRYQRFIDRVLWAEIGYGLAQDFLRRDGLPDNDKVFQQVQGLNMLNTRFIIAMATNPLTGSRETISIENRYAFGHAWYVDDIVRVDNDKQEFDSLLTYNLRRVAIVNSEFSEYTKGFTPGSTFTMDRITLKSYAPNKLVYRASASKDQLAVFSEIYYPKGWEVTIDGKEADYFRANYLLRAMIVPKGDHEIVFSFKPASYTIGSNISLASSILLLLLILGIFYMEVRKEYFPPKKN